MLLSLLPAFGAVVLFGFILHIKLEIRAAFTPFISVCGIILTLVFLGSWKILFWGTLLLYLLALGGGIFFVWKNPKAFLQFVASPAILAFLLGSLGLAIVYVWNGSFYSLWDDLAHWGPFFKNIVHYDALHQFTPQQMVHQAYPQGASVFYYFFAFFARDFSEAHTFASLGLLLCACATTLLGRAEWKKPLQASLLVAMVPLFFVLFPYSKAYTVIALDTAMGAVFGGVLVVLILCTERMSKSQTALVAVAAGALTQLKEMGFLLSLICIVLYAVVLLLHDGEKKSLGQTLRAGCNKRWALHSIAIFCGGLFPAVYWKLFLRMTGTAEDQFSSPLSGNFFGKVRDAAAGKNSVVASIWEQFTINFMHKPVVYNGYGTPVIMALLFCVAGLILGIWLWKHKKQRGVSVMLFSMPFFFAAYLFAIFYTYVCMMTEREGLQNASYERYISTFMIGWLMLILGVCLFWGYGFFKKFPSVLPLISVSAVLALLLNTVVQQDFLNVRFTRKEAGREGFDHVSAQMLAAMQAEDDVWVITQQSDSLYMYMYHYTLLPARVSISLPFSIGHPGTDTAELTSTEFAKSALDEGIEYILIYVVDDLFLEKYGNLFSDRLEFIQRTDLPSLYRVRQKGGEVFFEFYQGTSIDDLPKE